MVTRLLPRTATKGWRPSVKPDHLEAPVKVIQMSEDTLRRVIQESVYETLSLIGIEVKDPTEMQKDFNHLREWRETVESLKRKGLGAIVVTFISGVIGLIIIGIKNSLHP